ncbi:ras-specific guanine nucleotide-releasing factor 1-like [Homalodisca vitripennis]|uniref:ras-specific guanine nucleotide-releasing factor 1-like n=1 Tax=Homalodisca vitripennis TaxID=197043 RepID=UPI001EECE4D8|nr:ras-specific guanine nucleotide-releasing factor 1-like [Homalodisca vitripennis]
MDNVHFNDLLHSSMSDTSSVTMPQSIKNDPKLFKDDVDIRFSRTLNSCKVPQIRYATPERLLERLTDLRFLSIDFLNTFLLTYRVFTDSVTVLEALKKVFYNADPPESQTFPPGSFMDELTSTLQLFDPERRRSSFSPRRTSGASSVSGYGSEMSDCRDRSHSYDSQAMYPKGVRRCSFRNIEEEQLTMPVIVRDSPVVMSPRRKVSIRVEEVDTNMLTIPNTMAGSSSSETLTDQTVISAPSSPSNLSTTTLVASSGSDSSGQDCTQTHQQKVSSPPSTETVVTSPSKTTSPSRTSPSKVTSPSKTPPGQEAVPKEAESRQGRKRYSIESTQRKSSSVGLSEDRSDWPDDGEIHPPQVYSASSSRSASIVMQNYYSGYSARRSLVGDGEGGGSVSQRTSFQHDSPQNSSKAGVVITSFRQSQRR